MIGGLFAQNLPDFSQMSETEKMLIFQQIKKNPTTAVIYPLLFPTTGHAYANNWKRGLGFLGAEILGSYIVYSYSIKQAYKKEENVACPAGIYYSDGNEGSGCYASSVCEGCHYLSKGSLKLGAYTSALSYATLGFGLVRILEIVDATKEVKKYNNKLYKQIFGKEPPSFSMKLQPTYQGATLTMSYAFN